MAKSIKLNTVFKTLMSIVNIIFPLMTAPYVARVLSVDGYTEYNKAVSMLTWFSPIAVFGVYTYGMRTMSQLRNKKRDCAELFSKLFLFNSVTSVVTFFIFVLIVVFSSSMKGYKIIYFITSFQLLSTCFATDWYNEAFEDYGFILLKTFFCRLVYVFAIFLFVKNSSDVINYVLISSFSNIVNNLCTFFYAKRFTKFVKVSMHDEIKIVKPLFIVFLLVNSSMLYTIFDKFVLTWFGEKLQLTYYVISQTLITAIVNVTSSIIMVSIPRLSNLWAMHEEKKYEQILDKTSSVFLAVHTPCCIGVALLASEIMWMYSGDNYILGSSTLCLFALRYYISSFDMIQSKQVLLATGNEKNITKIYYFGGCCNICFKIMLIVGNMLSPELCIITTAISDIIVIFLEYFEVRKMNISVNLLSKNTIKYFFSSVLFIPIVFFVKEIVPNDNIIYKILEIFLSIFLCVLLYAIIMILSKDPIVNYVPLVNKFIRKEKNV